MRISDSTLGLLSKRLPQLALNDALDALTQEEQKKAPDRAVTLSIVTQKLESICVIQDAIRAALVSMAPEHLPIDFEEAQNLLQGSANPLQEQVRGIVQELLR